MRNRTFSELKGGDSVYQVMFAVHGVPTFTEEKIFKIAHRRGKSVFKIGSTVYDIKSDNTIYKSLSCIISPNKEEVVKIYEKFLKGMISQYEKEMEKCQKHIQEYTSCLNNL